MIDPVRSIATTVLYEGYLLYPYRASSTKNRQRWVMGGLVGAGHPPDGSSSVLQTEVVHRDVGHAEGRADGPAKLRLTLRFLHVCAREDGGEEAAEREHVVDTDTIGGAWDVRLPASEERGADGLVRRWRAVEAVLFCTSTPLDADDDSATVRRITARVTNLGASVLASAHVALACDRGRFASATDPAPGERAWVQACQQLGCWPILLGPRDARLVLAAPIILPDWPALAPESPRDLFDATEIDEILTLRVMTLTDAEKDEARRTDPRAAALIDSIDQRAQAELGNLHGASRAPFAVGDKVTVHPRRGGDALDGLLAGKIATIDAIERTFEGEYQACVTFDDDPGKDLGAHGIPGHRFFYRTDELARCAIVDPPALRVLIAGIGNELLGDDGFGVAVVKALAARPARAGIVVKDFGVRGFDLGHALLEPWDLAILIDAVPRGHAPGSLVVLDLDEAGADGPGAGAAQLDGHATAPHFALAWARSVGSLPKHVRLVGCEPAYLPDEDALDPTLSAVVRAAVEPAIRLVDELVDELVAGGVHA